MVIIYTVCSGVSVIMCCALALHRDDAKRSPFKNYANSSEKFAKNLRNDLVCGGLSLAAWFSAGCCWLFDVLGWCLASRGVKIQKVVCVYLCVLLLLFLLLIWASFSCCYCRSLCVFVCVLCVVCIFPGKLKFVCLL
jgi:hypothetical protein